MIRQHHSRRKGSANLRNKERFWRGKRR